MSTSLLVWITIAYLAAMFFIAQRTDRSKKAGSESYQALIYALSLGVYCTAWTFYGSIGRAATVGIDFLAIYVGPTLMMPLWWIVTRKVIRIVNMQHITSLADFLAARYGKDQRVGAMVAVVALLSITPYIALQIKAISESFVRITGQIPSHLGGYPGVITSIILCTFTILYGTRFVGSRTPRKGMVAVIAFESAIKLIALLVVGFVILSASGVWGDSSFVEELRNPEFAAQFTFFKGRGAGNWIILALVSGVAILILPRQFQVGVVENSNERHLKTAMWLLPLYLLLINIPVIPLALAGRMLPNDGSSDYFLIDLALAGEHTTLLPLLFIGGFSAATSMIIVSSIALGGMLSTNLIFPRFLKPGTTTNYARRIVLLRRLSIVIIFILAYVYGFWLIDRTPLVSIGMASFIGIAQLAPSFFSALYWKQATRPGAIAGIIVGTVIWALLLILPGIFMPLSNGGDPMSDHTELLGANLLNALGLERIPGTALISLIANTFVMMGVSLITKQSDAEQQQAALFSNAMQIKKADFYNTGTWRSSAPFPDVKSLLIKFLGGQRTEEVLDRYARINNIDFSAGDQADPRVISYAERLLTGTIGPASARIMLAHVVKDEEISIDKVVDIVTESHKVMSLNKALQQKSDELMRAGEELKAANAQLKRYAEIKNEFLYTVTHELRTPLTAIRAQAEMLYDDPEIPEVDRQHFLENIVVDCRRLTTLITNVLDLERFESGNFNRDFNRVELLGVARAAIRSLERLSQENHVSITLQSHEPVEIEADEQRIIQVLINLVSNAIKFTSEEPGIIDIYIERQGDYAYLQVCDNGSGIPLHDRERVFDKFYQSSANGPLKRDRGGSGLGLAICQNIVKLHGGQITITDKSGYTTCFKVELPLKQTT